jgi:hypothetical protein
MMTNRKQHDDGARVDDHLDHGQELGVLGHEEHCDAKSVSTRLSAQWTGWDRRITPSAPPRTMADARTNDQQLHQWSAFPSP